MIKATFIKTPKRSHLSGVVKKGDTGTIVDYEYCCEQKQLYAIIVLADGQTIMAEVEDIETTFS